MFDFVKDNFFGYIEIVLEVLKVMNYIELNGIDYVVSMVKILGVENCDLSVEMLKIGKVKFVCDEKI